MAPRLEGIALLLRPPRNYQEAREPNRPRSGATSWAGQMRDPTVDCDCGRRGGPKPPTAAVQVQEPLRRAQFSVSSIRESAAVCDGVLVLFRARGTEMGLRGLIL